MRDKEIAELRAQVRGLVLREQQMQAGAEFLVEEVQRLRDALRRVRDNKFEADKILCIVECALAATEPKEYL